MLSHKSIWTSFVALLFLPVLAIAQQQVVISLSANNDGEEDLEVLLESFEAQVNFRIEGRIAEIEQACDLTPEQRNKLIVAGKGAVSRFVNKQSESMKETLKGYQVRAGIEVEDDEDEDDEEKDKNKADKDEDEDEGNNRVVRNFAFVIQAQTANLVEDEPIWYRAIEKVLTKEQFGKLAEAREIQNEFLNRAAVDQFVGRIELLLFLTESQREKMKVVIAENFTDKLVNAMKHDNINSSRVVRARGRVVVEAKHKDLVKDFLTEGQLEEWCRSIDPILIQLERLPIR